MLPNKLSHDEVSCYIQTSKNGLHGAPGQWQRSAVFDIRETHEGNTTILSCYTKSAPRLFVRPVLQYGSGKGDSWDVELDQFVKMLIDGDPVAIQAWDIDQNSKMNPIQILGIFSENMNQFQSFVFETRTSAFVLEDDEKLPFKHTNVDELACIKLALHTCRITEAREERPDVCGLENEDKEVNKTRGQHARLSEYISTAPSLTGEDKSPYLDPEWAENVGVVQDISEEPWLVFKFYYKSEELLDSLNIKPKPKRKAPSPQPNQRRKRSRSISPARQNPHSQDQALPTPANRSPKGPASARRPSLSRSMRAASIKEEEEDLHTSSSAGSAGGVKVKTETKVKIEEVVPNRFGSRPRRWQEKA